jgi:hypothetical protein
VEVVGELVVEDAGADLEQQVGRPASGIKIGQQPCGSAQPLGQDDVDQAAEAAATPSARPVLVVAAVHAARTGAIRAAQLDDVDMGNRRLIIAGRVRPIDEFTHQILLDWLGYRRTRWPDTATPHLLINQHSAMGTGPVSTIYFAKNKLRGQAATPERLRVDRQLEEALAHGRDGSPGSGVRPRPQDRHPLRRERPPAPYHQGPRSKIPPVPANPRARIIHRA